MAPQRRGSLRQDDIQVPTPPGKDGKEHGGSPVSRDLVWTCSEPGAGRQWKKVGKKGKAAAAVDDDEDLDALLEKFREQWATEHDVHEEKMAEAPTRRANATLTPCPNGTDLWLFGGEYFDGDRALFYPDLYRYTPSTATTTATPVSTNGSTPTDGGVWRSYASANQPGPRSHTRWPRRQPMAVSSGSLARICRPRMNSFHHYRDLWVLHVASKQWERIDTKVRPSARSGHRMVCWKHFLVLFGGFQDTGVRTTYLGDLWLFDLSEYKWHEIKHDALRAHPAARSGFSLLACPDGVLLHGGYCKRYVKGQRTQGVALEDTWFLKLELGADGDLLHSGTISGSEKAQDWLCAWPAVWLYNGALGQQEHGCPSLRCHGPRK
ncbi:hypothetical protein L7F22_046366 [Adiantum nelumboides]|nr:hypothetical protein [Adiantum nelumboides]